MRRVQSVLVVAMTVASLTTVVPSGPAAAEGAPGARSEMHQDHDAMPPGMQRLHGQMMAGPASQGMQQMMSAPAATAGAMSRMMTPDAVPTPR